MKESELPYEEEKGEAAFYGPKIDFIIKSVIGTEYAISTNQLDFLAAKKFDLKYTASGGLEKPVYVIHRAPLGSHERFIGFLIEHYAGNFPIWLSPVQVIVIPISDKVIDYAEDINSELRKQEINNGSLGIRSEVDFSSERIQKKIRSATLRKIPILLIVGANEKETNTVSVRTRGGKDYGQIEFSKFVEILTKSMSNRNDNIFSNSLS